MQRDPIYAALLGQLQALQKSPWNVLTVSRGFVPWDAATAQPAIYIVPKTEHAEYKRGLPSKFLITLDIYVYVRWVDSVLTGITALTQIMDGIDTVLSPLGPNGGLGADNVNTLGGLAIYCALQGESDISGGYLNNSQTVARMAVEIMVA
jgi:hypothetical protein